MARDESGLKPDCCGSGGGGSSGSGQQKTLTCLLCQCFPPLKESKGTKCVYTLIVVLASSLMGAMMVPVVQQHLHAIFRDFNATCTDLKIGHNCLKLTGYMASFKISFSFGFFFILLGVFTVGVRDRRSTRAFVHNRMWALKLLVIVSLVMATFLTPISHLDQLHTSWIYTCLLGNWIFILLQTICLIDFSNNLCTKFKVLATRSKFWRAALVATALAVIAVWMVMSIVLFLIHGRQEYCLTKQFILIFNTGLCICLVLAALTPCARGPGRTGLCKLSDRQAEDQTMVYASRLTQVGILIVFVTFWIWSAMQSAPENPGVVELSFILDEDDLACRVPKNGFVEASLIVTSAFMMFFTIVYVSGDYLGFNRKVNKGNKKNVGSQTGDKEQCTGSKKGRPVTFAGLRQARFTSPPISVELGGNHGMRGELRPMMTEQAYRLPDAETATSTIDIDNEPTYSYSGFHCLLALSIMFITTQVTRWFLPDRYQSEDFDKSWTTVSMKIATGWSAGLLYLLYLLLPDKCLPGGRNEGSGNQQEGPILASSSRPGSGPHLGHM